MKIKFDIFLDLNKVVLPVIFIILIVVGMTLVSFGTYSQGLAYLGLLLFVPSTMIMLSLLLLLLYKI